MAGEIAIITALNRIAVAMERFVTIQERFAAMMEEENERVNKIVEIPTTDRD
jgi:hypothetical protein